MAIADKKITVNTETDYGMHGYEQEKPAIKGSPVYFDQLPAATRRRPSRSQLYWDGVAADLRREPTKWLGLESSSIPGKATKSRQSQIIASCLRRNLKIKTVSDPTHIYVLVTADFAVAQ